MDVAARNPRQAAGTARRQVDGTGRGGPAVSGDLALFDMEPAAGTDPQEKLSRDRRRAIRQKQALEHGQHPLGLLGAQLRLHPDAPPAGDRKASGPRCGNCVFSVRNAWDFIKCTRGRSGEIGTPSFRRGPFERASGATDLRAWWPGCERWEAAEAAR